MRALKKYEWKTQRIIKCLTLTREFRSILRSQKREIIQENDRALLCNQRFSTTFLFLANWRLVWINNIFLGESMIFFLGSNIITFVSTWRRLNIDNIVILTTSSSYYGGQSSILTQQLIIWRFLLSCSVLHWILCLDTVEVLLLTRFFDVQLRN